MDTYGSGARGGRSGDEPQDADRKAASDQGYSWGGNPGEDFGPIAPLTPSRPDPGRTTGEPLPADTVRTPATSFGVPPAPSTVTPTTTAPVRARRRFWRPMVTMLAVLLVLGGLVGGVLLVLSRQAVTGEGDPSEPAPPPVLAVASPVSSPEAGGTPAVAGSPATSGSPAAAAPASTATPAATATTAAVLGLGTVVPGAPGASPAAAGSPGATSPPATRATPTTIVLTVTPRAGSSPMAMATPTPPNLFPPGLRFPTNTPARIVATRTPPPVPTLRPPAANTPLRVDRTAYKVGEDASVCAQATHGSSAVIEVLGPDGTQRRLVEFQPPADRVCQILKLETPGIYVLTLVVKDGGGRELERHASVISASR